MLASARFALLATLSFVVFAASAHASAIDPTSQMPVPTQVPPAFAVIDPTSQMPVPTQVPKLR